MRAFKLAPSMARVAVLLCVGWVGGAPSLALAQQAPVTRATPIVPLLPEVPPAPTPAPPAQPDTAAGAPSSAEPADARAHYRASVFFDASVALSAASKAILDAVAEQCMAMDPEIVMAIGHTDGRGGETAARLLSIRRAEAVKAYLAQKGVVKNRIYAEGKGRPLPPDEHLVGANPNRVDIDVVGQAPPAGPAEAQAPQ